MKSNILDTIGMGSIAPAFYLIGLIVLVIILFVINIVTACKIKGLRRRYDTFMNGKNAESMEKVIVERFDQVDKLVKIIKVQQEEIASLKENMNITYQKTGIVKYDAFSEMGGKLSFALAMLDKNNTGYVVNAMHSREGCYTYIKEIIKGESYIQLGDEEKQAVEMAMNSDNYMVQQGD